MNIFEGEGNTVPVEELSDSWFDPVEDIVSSCELKPKNRTEIWASI
jgi:hypothetical protein